MSRKNRYAPNNLPRPPHWTDDAECRGVEDPDLFFEDTDAHAIEEAKGYCRGCSVREACLAGALDRREAHGTWGGLSLDERQAILAPVVAAEKAAARERKRAREEVAAPIEPVHVLLTGGVGDVLATAAA
ncbi:WhiB family transcriptional regulator [Kitasatospora aureofaciens]|uniref:WhiB family transcriptional regulator n=1 Tax=Kitasatospora aureofaciens TaxID=1894 RepID=UPI0033C42C47